MAVEARSRGSVDAFLSSALVPNGRKTRKVHYLLPTYLGQYNVPTYSSPILIVLKPTS